MKNIKKVSFITALVLVVACFMPILTGCFGGSDYKQFGIKYTLNLEFLVGEDYSDPNLKGTAVKKDGTEEDVTDRMTVNKSAYNKDVVGTYKIYCEFEGIETSYEVKVVNEITNELNVNLRLQDAIENTFKRDEDGVFSYEATCSTYYQEGVNLDEYMIFHDDNEDLSIYLKYSVTSQTDPTDTAVAIEYWYFGTKELGTLTVKSYGGTTTVDTVEDISLDDFNGVLYLTELPNSVFALGIGDVEADVEDCVLTKTGDTYRIECLDGFNVTYTNNVIEEVNGVEYTFPMSDLAEIPSIS